MIPKFRAWSPAPREVDRFLYKVNMIKTTVTNEFPSPLEVDRCLYITMKNQIKKTEKVSGPSRGR